MNNHFPVFLDSWREIPKIPLAWPPSLLSTVLQGDSSKHASFSVLLKHRQGSPTAHRKEPNLLCIGFKALAFHLHFFSAPPFSLCSSLALTYIQAAPLDDFAFECLWLCIDMSPCFKYFIPLFLLDKLLLFLRPNSNDFCPQEKQFTPLCFLWIFFGGDSPCSTYHTIL